MKTAITAPDHATADRAWRLLLELAQPGAPAGLLVPPHGPAVSVARDADGQLLLELI